MKTKINIKYILVGILLCTLILFLSFEFKEKNFKAHSYYRVYLSGKNIGLIESKEKLYQLIDKEQLNIKKKYNVDTVYPPEGLEVKKVNTYKTKLKSEREIYNEIKDLEPFTIEGYMVRVFGEDDKKTFYILNKEDLDIAVKNTITSFIKKEEYESYLNDTQKEIIEGGTEISDIYFDRDITIKKAYISTEEDIITNADDLSRYFLFGTINLTEKYKVKENDTIDTIAYNNELGVSDFLIANPEIVGENALLAVGQEVTVSAISPIANIVAETYETKYLDVGYDTQIEYDKRLSAEEMYVKQEGIKGYSKVRYMTKYMNGFILNNEFVSEEVISEPVDRIIVYGAHNISYVGSSTYWAWATSQPYRISSYYGYRIHPIRGYAHFHTGIDITGTRSDNIYAIQGGKVLVASYGHNGGNGNYVRIDHGNGYVSDYLHLAKIITTKGAQVEKGELIGIMGCTGSCTGKHLHLGVYKNGSLMNPFLLYQ